MKLKVFTIKKKTLIIAFLCLILIGCGLTTFFVVNVSAIPSTPYTIVIDAGHGGIDGGSVGRKTGAVESELNLAYAKTLSKKLNNIGIKTILTRSDENGLYDSSAKNLKKSDMKARKAIIDNANPTMVISIHMNSFSSSRAKGAKTFYKLGNEQGKALADLIQKQLNASVDSRDSSKVGDYYILNCTDVPAVLVECGFLSNEEDEKLLLTSEYQDKICYSILSGIVSFLSN